MVVPEATLFVVGEQAAIAKQMSRTPARTDKGLVMILTMSSAPRIRRAITFALAHKSPLQPLCGTQFGLLTP
jgi:hypothetical protein